MHLDRKANIAKVDSHWSYNDIFEYLSKMVNMFSALNIKREFWLTDRERDFFVTTIIVDINNCELPTDDEALQIYKKYFEKGINKQKILDRINKLSKKNWLIYVKEPRKKLIIPPFFQDIKSKKDLIDFQVRLDYEENKTSRPILGEDGPIEPNPRK